MLLKVFPFSLYIYDLKNKISSLEKQVEVQRTLKYKAIKARKAIIASNIGKVELLLSLVISERVNLTAKEIADLCYVTKKSVIDRKYIMKKERL